MNKNNRSKTPDIMSSLMSTQGETKQEKSFSVKPESNKTVEPESNKSAPVREISPAIKQQDNKAIKPDNPKASKEKTTFNLSTDTLESLEDAWIKLRRKLKGEQRITKTLVVEKAIEIALKDFDSRSELSDLFLRLKN